MARDKGKALGGLNSGKPWSSGGLQRQVAGEMGTGCDEDLEEAGFRDKGQTKEHKCMIHPATHQRSGVGSGCLGCSQGRGRCRGGQLSST